MHYSTADDVVHLETKAVPLRKSGTAWTRLSLAMYVDAEKSKTAERTRSQIQLCCATSLTL
jgi:hypothetical protein